MTHISAEVINFQLRAPKSNRIEQISSSILSDLAPDELLNSRPKSSIGPKWEHSKYIEQPFLYRTPAAIQIPGDSHIKESQQRKGRFKKCTQDVVVGELVLVLYVALALQRCGYLFHPVIMRPLEDFAVCPSRQSARGGTMRTALVGRQHVDLEMHQMKYRNHNSLLGSPCLSLRMPTRWETFILSVRSSIFLFLLFLRLRNTISMTSARRSHSSIRNGSEGRFGSHSRHSDTLPR